MADATFPSLLSPVVDPKSGVCTQPWYRLFLRIAAQNPPGTITIFGGASAPNGTLLCSGAAVSRTTYSALFSAVGTTFGPGDGLTTFNLPNIAAVVAGAKYYIFF